MKEPTKEELLDEEGLETVFRSSRDGWRHGADISQVFHRKSDDTYWQANYRRSTDGEYDGIAEGDYSIFEVEPYQVTKTQYRIK